MPGERESLRCILRAHLKRGVEDSSLTLTRRGGISRPHTRGPHGERAVGPRKGGVRECTVRRVRLPRACWRREQAVRVRLREAGEVL